MIPHWCTRNLVRHLNAQLLPIGNPGFSISPKEQIIIIIIIKKQAKPAAFVRFDLRQGIFLIQLLGAFHSALTSCAELPLKGKKGLVVYFTLINENNF